MTAYNPTMEECYEEYYKDQREKLDAMGFEDEYQEELYLLSLEADSPSELAALWCENF